MFDKNKIDSFESVLPVMMKIPLFADFNPENKEDRLILKEVYDNFSLKHYKKGELIIKEGDEGDVFFILYSGKVHVFRKTLSGDQISLAYLSSEMNIFFGETALIGQDTRSASISAETDCTTITLTGSQFADLCDTHPVLGLRVLRCLSKRLMKTVSDLNKDKAALYETLFEEIENGGR